MPSASPLDPLLADYRSVCSSIDASSLVLSSLKHQMADCYMDTLMKNTMLQRQFIQLECVELLDKVERLKMLGNKSRSTLSQLRKEYDNIIEDVAKRRSSAQPSTEPITTSSLNTWYTIVLFILPLVAIFMVSRMILAPHML